jgi:hypothetical protein
MLRAKIALMDFLTDRYGEAVGLSIYAVITVISLAALTWAVS